MCIFRWKCHALFVIRIDVYSKGSWLPHASLGRLLLNEVFQRHDKSNYLSSSDAVGIFLASVRSYNDLISTSHRFQQMPDSWQNELIEVTENRQILNFFNLSSFVAIFLSGNVRAPYITVLYPAQTKNLNQSVFVLMYYSIEWHYTIHHQLYIIKKRKKINSISWLHWKNYILIPVLLSTWWNV